VAAGPDGLAHTYWKGFKYWRGFKPRTAAGLVLERWPGKEGGDLQLAPAQASGYLGVNEMATAGSHFESSIGSLLIAIKLK